jgi:hypothetical protein
MHRYSTYEAVKMEDSSGWYVVFTPKDGPIEKRHGFGNKAEAHAWIQNEMHAKSTRRTTFRV